MSIHDKSLYEDEIPEDEIKTVDLLFNRAIKSVKSKYLDIKPGSVYDHIVIYYSYTLVRILESDMNKASIHDLHIINALNRLKNKIQNTQKILELYRDRKV